MRSAPFICNRTLTSEIYLTECLQKRLLPFLRKHSISILFWPDLVSCHYSTKTINWYNLNNINIVPKEVNPPNCPELRPIKKYWTRIKLKLRKTCSPANSMADFKSKWLKCTNLICARINV
ncbi:hypothetical protein ILUMI_25277 [Ignelater luminosus]|uniref:Uncharacterized protein n=1 Tax=Ignelater luminosus TaxID=2038154 RepID=A0A8K0C8V7_IGNLU|nr:hypothetical protein ILUMI_25277 [Ignelater luminosus]